MKRKIKRKAAADSAPKKKIKKKITVKTKAKVKRRRRRKLPVPSNDLPEELDAEQLYYAPKSKLAFYERISMNLTYLRTERLPLMNLAEL